MQIHHSFEELPATVKGAVMTLGNFDSVHRGHQALLKRVVSLARATARPALVVTFDPHPSRVLRPHAPVLRLYTLSDTLAALEAEGVDHVLVLPFTPQRAAQAAADFVTELIQHFAPSAVIVGHDFAFGRERAGSYELLLERGARAGFLVERVEPVLMQGELISSSLLRSLLASGEVEKMSFYLGRAYALAGRVVHGEGRGAGLGFATANIDTVAELWPASGVYVTEFEVGDRVLPSVTNVGRKPTFHDQHELSIETHVLDQHETYYDQEVRLRFLIRLRAELKFASAHELIKQIQQDVDAARRHFGRPK